MAAKKKPAEEARAKVSSRSRAKRSNGVGAHAGPIDTDKDKIARIRARLVKHVTKLRGYGLPDHTILKQLDAGLHSLAAALEAMDAIPVDWRPLRGTLGGPALEPGSVVHLAEKAVEKYFGLLDAATDLRVIKIVGGRIVCEADVDGAKYRQVMPRSHVRMGP